MAETRHPLTNGCIHNNKFPVRDFLSAHVTNLSFSRLCAFAGQGADSDAHICGRGVVGDVYGALDLRLASDLT